MLITILMEVNINQDVLMHVLAYFAWKLIFGIFSTVATFYFSISLEIQHYFHSQELAVMPEHGSIIMNLSWFQQKPKISSVKAVLHGMNMKAKIALKKT